MWRHYSALFTAYSPCYGQFFITWVLLCVHRGTCVLIISEIANLSSLYIAPAWVHKHHGIQKFHLLSQESNGQSAHNSHHTNLKDSPKRTFILKIIRFKQEHLRCRYSTAELMWDLVKQKDLKRLEHIEGEDGQACAFFTCAILVWS